MEKANVGSANFRHHLLTQCRDDLRAADAYRDLVLLKSSIRSWKAAKDRIKVTKSSFLVCRI